MSTLQVNSITNAAGSGAPNFPNGATGIIPAASSVWVSQANGHGSTNTKIRRWTTTQVSVGTDITYADSATLGGTFTINTTGVYAISYTDEFGVTFAFHGISVNSSQLTTNIESINNSDRAAEARHSATNTSMPLNCSATLYLQAGDVVRAHTSGAAAGGQTEGEIFIITRVQ